MPERQRHQPAPAVGDAITLRADWWWMHDAPAAGVVIRIRAWPRDFYRYFLVRDVRQTGPRQWRLLAVRITEPAALRRDTIVDWDVIRRRARSAARNRERARERRLGGA